MTNHKPAEAAPSPRRSVFAEPPEPASVALVPATMPARLPPPTPASRLAGAFWKGATLFSLIVNLVLLAVVVVLGLMIFQIKRGLAAPLIGGLHSNFVAMDEASIVTTVQVNDTIHVVDTIQVIDTIQVNDTLPVVFDLPLSTVTVVTLTRDIPVPNTTVFLNGLPVPTDIVLPAGTPLNIQLDLVVPVSQTVPVVLNVPVNLDVPVSLDVPISLQVPVNIPLNQTELHEPFTNLANLVAPYNSLLEKTPSSWADLFSPR
jgi:hypothetical protein